MSDRPADELPCVLLFNINGNGTGHLSTCLAYANRLRGRARPVFFSLASAVEVIHAMGFEADYFVSRFWSRATSWSWDQQLALRLGMLIERVRPAVIVFDGNWPYRGLLAAAEAYGRARLVWSNLLLFKPQTRLAPVQEDRFDLVIRLGEIGSQFGVMAPGSPGRRVVVPPVTILSDAQLLTREAARDALGLRREGRYALLSIGPGNLKDVTSIGFGVIAELKARGFSIVWARAPISAKDAPLPEGVLAISEYPLARYLHAFDVLVSAAGYNTCNEVLQSGIPALLIPNVSVSDDQTRRAQMVAEVAPAVVSPCETAEQRASAIDRLIAFAAQDRERASCDLGGADCAADEIIALAGASAAVI